MRPNTSRLVVEHLEMRANPGAGPGGGPVDPLPANIRYDAATQAIIYDGGAANNNVALSGGTLSDTGG